MQGESDYKKMHSLAASNVQMLYIAPGDPKTGKGVTGARQLNIIESGGGCGTGVKAYYLLPS